jgi:hypothetical protein
MNTMATPTDPLAFALAGNATFTVVSKKTDRRFTLKIRQKKDTPTTHFVSVLTGPNNEDDFEYLGVIWDRKEYRHGRTSRVSSAAISAQATKWVCERLLAGKELTNCELHHEGRCGRCGRKLTVPESILSGFGPECSQML